MSELKKQNLFENDFLFHELSEYDLNEVTGGLNKSKDLVSKTAKVGPRNSKGKPVSIKNHSSGNEDANLI